MQYISGKTRKTLLVAVLAAAIGGVLLAMREPAKPPQTWIVETTNGVKVLRSNYIPHPSSERVHLNAGQAIGPKGEVIQFLGILILAREKIETLPERPVSITANGATNDYEVTQPGWRKVQHEGKDGYATSLFLPISNTELHRVASATGAILTVRSPYATYSRELSADNIAALASFERYKP